MRQLVLLLPLLVLTGCTSSSPGKPLRYGEFPLAEYQALPSYGTGHISGRVYITTANGAIHPAAGQEVVLLPATPYMRPLYRGYTEQRPVAMPDPRVRLFSRQARADANGYFRFFQVPAGSFYLTCQVNGNVQRAEGPDTVGEFVMAPLELREGEKVQIELAR